MLPGQDAPKIDPNIAAEDLDKALATMTEDQQVSTLSALPRDTVERYARFTQALVAGTKQPKHGISAGGIVMIHRNVPGAPAEAPVTEAQVTPGTQEYQDTLAGAATPGTKFQAQREMGGGDFQNGRFLRPSPKELDQLTQEQIAALPRDQQERYIALQGGEPEHQGNGSWLDNTGFGGKVGLTGRAVMKGLSTIPGLVLDHTALPIFDEMFQSSPNQRISDVGTQGLVDSLADQYGMKTPTTSGERVYSDVVSALAGTPEGMLATKGIGAVGSKLGGLAGRGFKGLEETAMSNPILQATSAGIGSGAAGEVRESGGNSTDQLIAALAAGSAPQIIGMGKDALVRRLMLGSGDEGLNRLRGNIDTYAKAGTTPLVGEATEGPTAQAATSMLSRQFGTSGIVQKAGRAQEGDIQKRITGLVDSLASTARPAEAGNAAYQGVEDYFKPAAKGIISDEYKKFDDLFPDQNVDMKPFRDFVAEKASPSAGLKTLGKNEVLNPSAMNWGGVLKDLDTELKANGGKLPFSSVKELRTMLGERLSDTIFDSKLSPKELKGAYAALSDTMMQGAKAAGNGADVQLAQANRRAAEFFDHMELIRPIMDRSGGGEKIFEGLLAGNKNGATRLEAVYNSIPPETRKDFSSAAIRLMARTSPRSQSADMEHFFKNYENLSPEGRKQIFGAISPEFAQNFEDVANAVEKIKQTREDFGLATKPQEGGRGFQMVLYPLLFGASTGASAAMGLGADALGTGAAAIAGTGGALLAGRSAARWLTNPKTVHFLAQTTKVPPSQVPQMILQLENQGRRDKDQDLVAFSQYLQARMKEGQK